MLGVESFLLIWLKLVFVIYNGVVDEFKIGELECVLLVSHSLGDVSVVLEKVDGLVQIVKIFVHGDLSFLASFFDVLFEVLLVFCEGLDW